MTKVKSLITYGFYCLVLTTLTTGQQTALGQSLPDECQSVNHLNFTELADLRGQLKTDVPELVRTVKDLEGKIKPAAKAQDDLRQTTDKLSALENKPTRSPADQAQIDSLTKQKLYIENFLGGNTVESYQQDLGKATAELSAKKTQLQCVEGRIASFLSPEERFKFWMSLFFATLIGLVIVGFFVLSFKDGIMRRAIFSGQAGMQFLTLFSIVIAIILFGITGILHDKELAALLGGLSGYILGRYSTPDSESSHGGGTVSPLESFVKRLASMSIAPDTVSLTPAAPSKQLTITPKDGSGNTIQDPSSVFKPYWVSSDPALATVDQSGLVTRVSNGNCTITATFESVDSNACNVTCT